MATYYKQVEEGVTLSDAKSRFLAMEFRGYIAGLLEGEVYKECAKKKPRDRLTYRAAVIATQDAPNSEKTKFNVRYALTFACDDSIWKK